MPLVQGSSDFDICNNQITVVEGSQYNDNRTFQIVRRETRKLTIWDEFERVRTGNINLIKAVATSDIYDDNDGPWWSRNRNRRTVARRTISIARIRGEDKEAEFLYVGYSGPEARQAFERDFDQFSAVKHLNVAQLFGYSDSQYGLPALIFYDALIPLNHVLLANERINHWRWVKTYFTLHAIVAGLVENSPHTDPGALWIEPRSGALRRGPYVRGAWSLFRSCAPFSISHFNPLSIQTYSDTNAIVDYLIRTFPIDTIFVQRLDLEEVFIWETELSFLELWPYLVNLRWKEVFLTARWTGLTPILREVCVSRRNLLPKRRVVMKDGSVRLRFTDFTDTTYLLRLRYKLFHGNRPLDIRRAWLAQAHSIFSQLGIPEYEWGDYSITDRFYVQFRPIEVNTYQTASNKPTPYLFVRPIPHLSDDKTTWRSWAESTYFWSFDRSGQEEMSESTRVSLGLPSFETEISVRYRYWDCEMYKLMERFQHFKGFDPTTTDYARSCGYPLMQVVPDEDRFQELGESMMTARLINIIPPPRPNDTSANEMPGTETDEEVTGSNAYAKVRVAVENPGFVLSFCAIFEDTSSCGGGRKGGGSRTSGVIVGMKCSLGGDDIGWVDKDLAEGRGGGGGGGGGGTIWVAFGFVSGCTVSRRVGKNRTKNRYGGTQMPHVVLFRNPLLLVYSMEDV
ncbi:hypothetical protein Moror_11597 [Moniliophthora roreri MCA 2997]|uniref:Protein kinase domain-containing protein n=1 Tax=Moniliophthora roreri (strain MCA 2997) TaxID=1381753 RepID=V2X3V4_MONRO|nr:hypothetical protein Moror_11597 [Moniliophthora roreri MCA 2997]